MNNCGISLLAASPGALAVLLLTAPSSVHAHHGTDVRYVAPTGSDEGDCIERPCRTIEYAIGRTSKGGKVLVAEGTYHFDPGETALLLSDIVEVRGGYSHLERFERQAPREHPTYIVGLPHEHRARLAERGFFLVQDLKGLEIEGDPDERARERRLAQPITEPPPGTTRLVAPNGVDEGDCIADPCRTPEYAAEQASRGDSILLAAGTYFVDPGEIATLLSSEIPVLGGFSALDRFRTRAPSENLTYIIGAPPQHRARLAERGLILVQDLKALEIEEAIREPSPLRGVAPQPATPCVGGMAGVYPCKGVDFLARVALHEFSTDPTSANDIWGFVDLNDNREYAIIGLRNGTAVVDVSDPENPVEVGTIPGKGTTWRDIKVYQFPNGAGRWEAYAYVTADAVTQGMQIIDLTDLPTSVTLAATYNGFASAHNVYMGNIRYDTGEALPGLKPYAYILGSNLDLGAFRVLDLSPPTAPVEVTAPPPGAQYSHDATTLIIDDARTAACRPGHNPCEVFVDYNETTVDLWDVTDKSAPLQISSTTYANASYTHSGWWTGDKMFVFIQDELDERNHGLPTTLRTLDISDLMAPTVSNVWSSSEPSAGGGAIDHNGFAKGARYYMSNYRRGLTVFDISDPNDPQEAAFFDTFPTPAENNAFFNGAWGVYPYLPSGTILVSDIEGGLFVLRESGDLEPPPGEATYQYAAKLICGLQREPDNMRLARGFYATAINVHNPQEETVTFSKKLALTFPPEEQRPGKVMPIDTDELRADQALEVDCIDIRRKLFPNGFPPPGYIKGFVIIQSDGKLDVEAVYSTAKLDRQGEITEHSGIDVERIPERETARRVDDEPGPQAAFLEVDKMEGTEFPPDAVTDSSTGSGVTLPTLFAAGDLALDVRQDDSAIAPEATVTNQRLHELMTAHRNPAYAETPDKWSTYLIVAKKYGPDPNVLGIIFDYGGADLDNLPREGVAVFYDAHTDSWSGQRLQDELFLTSGHELGHAFNLHHTDWEGSTFHNSSTVMSYSLTPDVLWRFSDRSVDHLRRSGSHSDEYVKPRSGGKPFGTIATDHCSAHQSTPVETYTCE